MLCFGVMKSRKFLNQFQSIATLDVLGVCITSLCFVFVRVYCTLTDALY